MQAYSQPITPPPKTSMFAGHVAEGQDRVRVETRGSSNGKIGGR